VAANILINDKRKALLSDFGLSNLAFGAHGSFFMGSTVGGSPRWAALELYCLEDD
jgi:serine/threonine protein kinase